MHLAPPTLPFSLGHWASAVSAVRELSDGVFLECQDRPREAFCVFLDRDALSSLTKAAGNALTDVGVNTLGIPEANCACALGFGNRALGELPYECNRDGYICERSVSVRRAAESPNIRHTFSHAGSLVYVDYRLSQGSTAQLTKVSRFGESSAGAGRRWRDDGPALRA
ncbi:hypothetical protein DFP72DRAFT_850055 [Ephemerocybe angulata]|uniref:Uncharacterized protein n=1 Tax=Ephemerocybe angulata TaxID=980116 RepID=A0A8H6M2N3_9AGAR|nr:hypothetical protein DFP72DRAFT_850055 [Tulosesus angulatus]